MNVDIASLVVNTGASDGWWKVFCSGLFPAIIGGVISGGITFWAVKSTNKENREIWSKDIFMKRKQECFIEFYAKLNDFCYFLKRFINRSNHEYFLEDDFGEKDRKYIQEQAEIFSVKFTNLFFAYKNILPYLNKRIFGIDKKKLKEAIDMPTLEGYFHELKRVCNDEEYQIADFSHIKGKISSTGGAILLWIEESKAIEYLEKEIIL